MMRRLPLGISLMAGLLWTSALAAEDLKPETIRRGKRSTAMLVLGTRGYIGSAYCIDPSGYFITNEHAIHYNGGRNKLLLVINSAEADEKTFEAEIMRSDRTSNLALLRVIDGEKHKFTALEFVDVDELFETQQVIAFGYPLAFYKGVKDKQYPSVTAKVGRITTLRKTAGTLERIDIDELVGKRGFGGLLIDTSGKAVGMLRLNNFRPAQNYAIPATHVQDFLAKPELIVPSPTVAYKDRHEPLELAIRAVRFSKTKQKLDVAVALGSSEEAMPLVSARLGKDGVYRVRVVPITRRKTAPLWPIVLTFSDGSVRCETPDRDVLLDGKKYRLSKISRIERSKKRHVIELKDGTTLTGKTLTVGQLKADLGGYVEPIDADQASEISVGEIEAESDKIEFRVVVKRDGTKQDRPVIATASGVISIERPPADDAGANSLPDAGLYQPPQRTASFEDGAEKVIFQMPQAYARYTLAGSGRYFVFHLKEAKKLVIMDVLSGKTAAEIPGVTDDVLIAGGAEKLVVVLPGQKLMQRFSLKTFKREKVAPLPGPGTTRRAQMGANSRGPLFLGADRATLVDLDTLKPIELDGKLDIDPTAAVRISYGGRTIAEIRNNSRGSSILMKLRGNTITSRKFGAVGSAFRWAWPTADGSLITMSGGGLYDPHLNVVAANWLRASTLFPTVDPRYFLSVKFAKNAEGDDVTQVRVCTTADRRIVQTYVGMQEMAPRGNTNSRNAIAGALNAGSTHFHYVPWANVLISMPRDKKQIVLRRFDLMKSLEAAGEDYLFVDSVPPTEATKGRTLTYQIAVKSKRGGVTYKLEFGPAGMKVTDRGLLTWNTPPELTDKAVQAVVAVADASGRDVLHSLQMAVRDLSQEE